MSVLLYLSRRIDSTYYGVVNTDGDIEIQLTEEGIIDAINRGEEIKGVFRDDSDNVILMNYWPYQDERYIIPAQAKAKTLLGVEIHRYKSEISLILINPNVTQDGTRIRLSEYGNAISWFCPVAYNPLVLRGYVVLVLDDNIRMLGNPYVCRRFVIFDISEVTDASLVNSVYMCMMQNHIQPPMWKNHVIDKPKRMAQYIKYYYDFKG